MLSYCDALWLASPGNEETLRRVADEAGLRSGAPYGGGIEPRGPICFYPVDHRAGDDEMRDFLAQLRASPLPDVRFAPVIVVAEESAGALPDYRRWGFDDVIILPDDRHELTARFAAQLHREILYYETPTYLGPDRRRKARAKVREPARPSSRANEHRFVRDPLEGTHPVRPPDAPRMYVPPELAAVPDRLTRK
jgi:hypothetical protein